MVLMAQLATMMESGKAGKGENANLIIDFKKEDLINEVIFGFLESHDVWIFLPKKINVSFLDERLTVLKQDSLF